MDIYELGLDTVLNNTSASKLTMSIPVHDTGDIRGQRSYHLEETSPFNGWIWWNHFPGYPEKPSPYLEITPILELCPHDSPTELSPHAVLVRGPISLSNCFGQSSCEANEHTWLKSGADSKELPACPKRRWEKERRVSKHAAFLAKTRDALRRISLPRQSRAVEQSSDCRGDSVVGVQKLWLEVKSVSSGLRKSNVKEFYNRRADDSFGPLGWREDEQDQDTNWLALNTPAHLPGSPLCPNLALGNDRDEGGETTCPFHGERITYLRDRHTA